MSVCLVIFSHPLPFQMEDSDMPDTGEEDDEDGGVLSNLHVSVGGGHW